MQKLHWQIGLTKQRQKTNLSTILLQDEYAFGAAYYGTDVD